MGCVLAVSVCGEQGRLVGPGAGGGGNDVTKPVPSFVFGSPAARTVQDITDSLRFTVKDTDDVKLDSVWVAVGGIAPLTFGYADSSKVSATSFTKPYVIPLPRNAAGQKVVITATASDLGGNDSTIVDTVAIVDQKPPALTMNSPGGGMTVGAGDTLRVIATAEDPSGVARMGAEIFTLDLLNRPVVRSVVARAYAQAAVAKVDTFRLPVPQSLTPGAYLVHAFAADSAPAPANADSTARTSVTVVITRSPTGNFLAPTGGLAVAAGDSVLVRFHATDSSGIARIAFQGFKVTGVDSLGTATTVPRFLARSDSLPLARDTTLNRYLIPVLTDSSAAKVYITATVTNSGGLSTTIKDSVQIVTGPTVSVTSPATGTRVPVGVALSTTVTGFDPSNLDTLGFVARGSVPDSQLFAISPLATNATRTFSTTVGAGVAPGTADTIVPFAVGVSHTRFQGKPVIVTFVDNIAPTITKQGPSLVDTVVTAGDSVFVQLRVQDNRGVTAVTLSGVAYRGVPPLGTLTAVTRYTPKTITLASKTDTTLTRYLNAVATDSTVEAVYVIYVAQDSSGNVSRDSIRIQVANGPFVRVTSPASGSRQPVGVPVSVGLSAFSRDSIKVLGFTATGAVSGGDSSVFASPLAQTQTATRSLSVSTTAPLGVDTIVPFATTALGKRFTGTPIVVSFADTVKPTVTVQLPSKTPPELTVAVGDSVFTQVHVTDNKGVVSVVLTGVAQRGSVALGTDTVVTRFTPRSVTLAQRPDTVLTRYLRAVIPLDSTGEFVKIIATATDSSGNLSADTSQVRIVSGPRVTILAPADSALTSPGKSLTVQVRARGELGVRILGWRATGVLATPKSDSVIASPVGGVLSDTLTFSSTLSVPVGTPVGTISITGFAADSTGNPSAAITARSVLVQPTGVTDVTPPLVQFTVPLRVEVGDSITVHATDAGGIARLGFIVHHLGLADTVQQARWADTLNGTQTDVSARFRLNLDTVVVGTSARQITVEAFAYDSVLNRGVSSFSGVAKSSPADQDTLTLVAGTTIALPRGGQIGDAIVNPNRNELYLTNTLLDELEVFQLNTNTFAANPIPVGANPVGIALWPHDTLGGNADTVIVANSGGTNLSIVDVATGSEVSRHRLPNYLVQTVKTALNAGGGVDVIITEYDLADRPQYLGAVCRHGAGSCDSVIAVYSTAPTGAQASPFAGHGYVAWDNLKAAPGQSNAGHFFFEPALGGATNDTLQIIAVRDTAPGIQIRDTIVGAGVGLIVNLQSLAFQDSTFVRNSGNFVHALIGEGGLDQGFARVLSYDASRGLAAATGTTCAVAGVPLMCGARVDSGVSPSIYVRDFVTNRASPVRAVATNFNGRTNAVRADSIYAFDFTLRQTGLMQTGGGFAGIDFDPNNSFDAATRTSTGLNKNDRLIFAARADAGIDIFDTFFYGRVATVPIRDTIIGPIRVASSGGTLILAGVTSRGLVVVRLPSFTNPFPVAPALPQPVITQARPALAPVRPAPTGKRAGAQP